MVKLYTVFRLPWLATAACARKFVQNEARGLHSQVKQYAMPPFIFSPPHAHRVACLPDQSATPLAGLPKSDDEQYGKATGQRKRLQTHKFQRKLQRFHIALPPQVQQVADRRENECRGDPRMTHRHEYRPAEQ